MNDKPEEKIEELDLSDKDDLEIVELDKQEKIENTLETRKENKLLFIIIGVIILFALLLPTITRIFRKTSIFSYTSEVEDITSKGTTAEGLLEIGSDSDGSITVKNIQFYSFRKESNNVISFVYLPGSAINKVAEENIFVELYNNKKNPIYRTKFAVDSKLERKVRGTYRLELNENIYGEATYAKVVILNEKDFVIESSALTCTIEEKNTDYNLISTVVYNFSTNGLTSYIITKEKEDLVIDETITNEVVTENEETDEENTTIFDEEVNEIKDYVENLEYDETMLTYKVDLLNGSLSSTLFDLGNTPRQIKLASESDNWSCK